MLPCPAQLFYMRHHAVYYAVQLPIGESIVFPKVDRPGRTVQVEYGLTTTPEYMYVGGPMIIRIDDNTQAIESQDCRHDSMLSLS